MSANLATHDPSFDRATLRIINAKMTRDSCEDALPTDSGLKFTSLIFMK